jgi:pantoate--beta-alanine ligase
LFALVMPDRAYFGEKDFEQLTVIRRLVADLGFRIEVVGMPTVREPDGLALSSRNLRLSPAERAAAPVLHRALVAGATRLATAGGSRRDAEAAMASVLAGEPLAEVDYAVARQEAMLAAPPVLTGRVRLLVAARFGAVRLIDNLAVDLTDTVSDSPDLPPGEDHVPKPMTR